MAYHFCLFLDKNKEREWVLIHGIKNKKRQNYFCRFLLRINSFNYWIDTLRATLPFSVEIESIYIPGFRPEVFTLRLEVPAAAEPV